MALSPTLPSPSHQHSLPARIPPQQPQDLENEKKNWLRKAFSVKQKHSAREAKKQFRRPDTSSLKAFFFSLLSCSGHGAHHSEDSSSEDIISDTNIDHPVLSSLMGSSNCNHNIKNCGFRGGTELNCHDIEPDALNEFIDAVGTENDSDWQLITKHDLSGFEKNSVSLQKILSPRMSDTSLILPESIINSLYYALPTLVHDRKWMLLYSTWKHGISLLTLYRSAACITGHCLLAASDERGTVFGGLLTSPLIPSSEKKYQGTNETFVFTNVLGKLCIFHATGLNRYFVLCMNNSLAFGGGAHFALYLDEELLHGSSGPCETFGNCCLAQTEDFVIKHIELWGFVHESRCTSKDSTFKDLAKDLDFHGSSDIYRYPEAYEWP